MTAVQPYLVFEGLCEEALDFYQRKLGAKINMLMRVNEAPPGDGPAKPGTENKIMHVAFTVGGEVRTPITETFFSPRFGMVADKFGLTWMVVVPRETQP
jgi:PhnB protein